MHLFQMQRRMDFRRSILPHLRRFPEVMKVGHLLSHNVELMPEDRALWPAQGHLGRQRESVLA